MLFTWFLTACVVVIILAMPNLLTTVFGFDRASAFQMQSAAIIMQMLGCILAGTLADRFGCAKVMMMGATALAVVAAFFITVWGMPVTSLFSCYTCYWDYAQGLWAWCHAVW
jgi:nitrate/nitrite transporter NarK